MCARIRMTVCARARLREGAKPGAQHEKYYSTKGIKSHKYIYRESWDIYMNTQIRRRRVRSNAGGGSVEGGLRRREEKMNDTENRKIKHFIVWVRHAFIILIGSV